MMSADGLAESRKYKTGDPHPEWNQTAFVDYCECGREVWTSVYMDKQAPYRLAEKNAQLRNSGKNLCECKTYTEANPLKSFESGHRSAS